MWRKLGRPIDDAWATRGTLNIPADRVRNSPNRGTGNPGHRHHHHHHHQQQQQLRDIPHYAEQLKRHFIGRRNVVWRDTLRNFRYRNRTRYRAAKRYTSTDGSSTGLYRWCSHLANASEAASLPFRSLLMAVRH